MVVHPKVDEAHPDATAQPHDQWRGHGTANSVKGQPIPFHVGGIGDGVVRQQRPFLQHDAEVVIHDWSVRSGRVQNKHSDHSHHLLHGRVRMIEEGAILMNGELVGQL
jgi:hypothetical protein